MTHAPPLGTTDARSTTAAQDNVADNSEWSWHWRMVSYGRRETRVHLGQTSPVAQGDRIEYRHDGVTEWYENMPAGLEQGFDVNASPRGEGPLVVRGAVITEGLRPELDATGSVVRFHDALNADVLHYGGLIVRDAEGTRLPATIAMSYPPEAQDPESREAVCIELTVDDTEAIYPVIVDPMLARPATRQTLTGGQRDAFFGAKVAPAGDTNGDGYDDVVVTAPNFDDVYTDEGRAMVFHGSESGLSSSPFWTIHGEQDQAYLGVSAASAGDVNGDGYDDLIVAATNWDGDLTDEGKAMVYHGSPTGLATTPSWTAEGDQESAHFGGTVASAGDVNGDGYDDVIVAAVYYDSGESDEGKAFVFLGSASGIGSSPAWTTEGNQENAFLGVAAASAGDVDGDGFDDVIVGSAYYDNGETDEGRAFVFAGSATGLGSTPTWSADGGQAYAYFASAAGAAGDVNGDGYGDVVIGAPYYDADYTDEGRALVYYGSADGLESVASWALAGGQDYATFGAAAGAAGDVNNDGMADIIVGASQFDDGEVDEGASFVYHGAATGLRTVPAWSGFCDQAYAYSGLSVATAGDVDGNGCDDVIVGASYYDDSLQNEGGAFVYLGSPTGIPDSAPWSSTGLQDYAYLGASVADAGDVDGDGYDDVIVGVPYFDNSLTDQGAAFVFHGTGSGLLSSSGWSVEGDQEEAYFGSPVATAGDVNGDGYSDVIVGETYYDGGQTDEGRVSLFLGSADGLNTDAAWTAEANQNYAYLGASIDTAGDTNGDGYDDIIISATYYDNGQTDEGAAFVYLGSTTGLATGAAWIVEGSQDYVYLGASVATAGDTNGDGYDDVIIGATYYDNGQTDEGRALLFLGSATGPGTTPGWTAEGDQASAYFGASVASAGDINADGYDDIIVGATYYDNGQTDEGRVVLYLGGAEGPETTPVWTAEGNQEEAYLGASVSGAGDVNGDGYDDVVVGATYYDNGNTDEGRASVYLGSAEGLPTEPDWTTEGGQDEAYLGVSVSGAGDVNGDGADDIIIGASGFDSDNTDEGQASVFYGSRGGLPTGSAQVATGGQHYAYFGASVASAGDVNQDGYDDVAVGASYYDGGQADEGAVFVFLGSESGLGSTPDWTTEGDQKEAYLGTSLAGAGDVNGDGFDDLAIGATGYDNGETDEGAVFLFLGTADGLAGTPVWMADGDQGEAYFGRSVAGAGDVNGDGYADLVVGASGYDGGSTDEGAAFLFLGSESGPSTEHDWSATGGQQEAYFGIATASAGDVNADGFSDVLVGASNHANGQTNEGRACLFFGSAAGLSVTPDWVTESNQADAYLGLAVSAAGDVNGDGFADIAIASAYYTDNETNEGRVLVFYGAADGPVATPDWALSGGQSYAYFGASIARAGDTNADGYDDLVIGSSGYDYGSIDDGLTCLYLGSADGLSPTTNWYVAGWQAYAYTGTAVAGAADVNGDGCQDIIVGAPYYDNGFADEGALFIYLGAHDMDGDGQPDAWEVDHGLDPGDYTDATTDNDDDGLTNVAEYWARTDPANPDTDGDGSEDGDEQTGLHPYDANTDWRISSGELGTVKDDWETGNVDDEAPDFFLLWTIELWHTGDYDYDYTKSSYHVWQPVP